MKSLRAGPCMSSISTSARACCRLAALAVLLLVLAACTAPGGPPVPEDPEVMLVLPTDAEDLPPDTTILDRLADYHGLTLDPEARARLESQESTATPVSASLIEEVLDASGFTVFTFRGTLEDAPTGIRYNLARGRPPLLLLERDGGKGAWVLLVGYDGPTQVYVQQRADGGIAGLRFADLHRDWSAAGQVTILALPDQQNEP